VRLRPGALTDARGARERAERQPGAHRVRGHPLVQGARDSARLAQVHKGNNY